jgi:glyoxylase-like metal-dependent hydrolase (beta-lactamase superfamily II)
VPSKAAAGHSSSSSRRHSNATAAAAGNLAVDSRTSNTADDADAALVDLLLLSGDTVFPGSCGRLDLPGSDPGIMYDSLRILAALPGALPVYPGHSYGGSSSTIGREKETGLLRDDISRAQWMRMMAR